jgi:GH24 family phage-related lysozyme (muramidase)
MHTSVSDVFPEFSKRFEGYVHWMYLDIKGLVTIGVGNLINTEATVTSLPFKDLSGTPARKDQILAEWNRLRATPELAQQGHKACEKVTKLRLDNADIDALVRHRLKLNEAALEKTFAAWAQWPADAQLGVLSMAWAMGSAFSTKWPKFTAACVAQDWLAAIGNCRIKEAGNPGIVPRNAANRLLFGNAQAVLVQKLDRARLFYPEPVPVGPATPGA